jgi:D-arabinose 1-dehydrogenase-like Zn-dependent alcohol dehydrogenase
MPDDAIACAWARYMKVLECMERVFIDRADPCVCVCVRACVCVCASTTVYNPLRTYITRPNMKVAIIAIGGLGHMGIQFARALGAEVTAISSTASKAAEAKQLGAHHFINSAVAAEREAAKGTFDFILDTAPVPIGQIQQHSQHLPTNRNNDTSIEISITRYLFS